MTTVPDPSLTPDPRITAVTREVDRLRQRVAELETTERCCTECGNGDLYPRRCSQCGRRWADMACGPTHALIAAELGLNDLRRELAELRERETVGKRDG